MSFDNANNPGTFDTMSFRLAKYNLNGTFLGWEPLTTQLEYCNQFSEPSALDTKENSIQKNIDEARQWIPMNRRNPASADLRWLKFGNSYSETYYCDLNGLLAKGTQGSAPDVLPGAQGPFFYDMYMVDKAKTVADGESLYPVPVRNRNYRTGNTYVNDNTGPTDEDNDRFVRRFFLYDTLSGVTTVGSRPEILRYASEITLKMKIRPTSDREKGKIFPPILSIKYVERRVPSSGPLVGAMAGDTLTFRVEYTQDMEDFWRTSLIMFSLCSALVAVVWIVRVMLYCRRNQRAGEEIVVSGSLMFRILSFAMSSFTRVMFWFLFVFCLYWVSFFKLQSDVFVLIPPDMPEWYTENDYYPFRVLLILCWFGQVFRILEIFSVQCFCKVFFMDWEKSRGKVIDAQKKPRNAPVSAWRSIFVANEWSEMQSMRATNHIFTNFFVLFLLVGCDLQYLATPQPNTDDLSHVPHTSFNIVLRFANVAFWWLVVHYGQVLWLWAIWQRWVTEVPSRQFRDMCTMANLSVFILDERFHGYYVHCRSPHRHADTHMGQISRDLQRMEENLMSQGGLEYVDKMAGGKPMFDCFELYVSRSFRLRYDDIYGQYLKGTDLGGRLTRSTAMRNQQGNAPSKNVTKGARQLNVFLQNFVDKSLGDE